MNVSKECHINLALTKKVLALELPIYTQRLNQAEALLGGLISLERAHQSESQFLPIKLRPSEPSCKPIYADRLRTQAILIRIKRKVVKSDALGHDARSLQMDVVGIISEKYECKGMADFQYFTAKRFVPLPYQPKIDNIQYNDRHHDLSVRLERWKHQLRPYLSVSSYEEIELIPEVFSEVDVPLRYEFRQRYADKDDKAAKLWKSSQQYLSFSDDIPVPLPSVTKEADEYRFRRLGPGGNVCIKNVEAKLTKMLSEKPVWLRMTVMEHFNQTERRIAQHLLRKTCYVFLDGPWRGSWIRKGYDPRQTKESARYQVLELRNSENFAPRSAITIRRRPRVARLPNFTRSPGTTSMKRRRNNRLSVLGEAAESDKDTENHKDGHQEPHSTVFGVPYSNRSMLFQLETIDDPDMIAWIERFEITESKPSLLSGWYSQAMFTVLRELLRFKIAVMRNRDAAELASQQKRIDRLKEQVLRNQFDSFDCEQDEEEAESSKGSQALSKIPFADDEELSSEQDENSDVVMDEEEQSSEQEEQNEGSCFVSHENYNNCDSTFDTATPSQSTDLEEIMTECIV